jgi:hypothetical protein
MMRSRSSTRNIASGNASEKNGESNEAWDLFQKR